MPHHQLNMVDTSRSDSGHIHDDSKSVGQQFLLSDTIATGQLLSVQTDNDQKRTEKAKQNLFLRQRILWRAPGRQKQRAGKLILSCGTGPSHQQ